jgi:3-oxoacyl-[acyl-carrier protein] reductase
MTPTPDTLSGTFPDTGRIALVSGGAGGLGRACSAALAMQGMHVVVSDLDGEAAARVSGELAAAGLAASSAAVDVSSHGAVDVLVKGIVSEYGRIDVVVNLAGVIRNAVLSKIEDSDFRLVMATHVEGTLNTMRAATPVMKKNGYGRVVNMSSLALRGSIAGVSYGAAKGAIEGITRSAAMELAKDGVTVNCVAPGLIAAGMFLTVPQEYQDASAARIPMNRVGEAAEVAACVSFFASQDASYVTGQTLLVCGGLSLGF